VMVFLKSKKIRDDFPYLRAGSKIGSSSLRRKSQFELLCPEMQIVELRGNVPTRIAKLFSSDGPDAVLLSAAGIERLTKNGEILPESMLDRLDELHFETLGLEYSVPAPGQGALALQCRSDDTKTKDILASLNRQHLKEQVTTER